MRSELPAYIICARLVHPQDSQPPISRSRAFSLSDPSIRSMIFSRCVWYAHPPRIWTGVRPLLLFFSSSPPSRVCRTSACKSTAAETLLE